MEFLTIEGFESLTRQQMFDMSVKHIGSTGVKSVSNSTCCYSGTGCAASVFLKDAEARMSADNMVVPTWNGLANARHVPAHEAEFVRELQTAHDTTDNNPHYPGVFQYNYAREMVRFAQTYNLDDSEVIKLGWLKA